MLTQHSFIVIHIHAFAFPFIFIFIFVFVFVFIQWLLHTLLFRLVLFYWFFANRNSGLFHLLVFTCVFVTCLSGSLKWISVNIYLVISCVFCYCRRRVFLIIILKPLKMQEEQEEKNVWKLFSALVKVFNYITRLPGAWQRRWLKRETARGVAGRLKNKKEENERNSFKA